MLIEHAPCQFSVTPPGRSAEPTSGRVCWTGKMKRTCELELENYTLRRADATAQCCGHSAKRLTERWGV